MRTRGRRLKPHIKKGDIVVAIAGEDAVEGKTGKVLQVLPGQGRAIVEGFHLVKKHLRKSQDNPKGGIADKEAPVALSQLKVHDAAADKAAKARKTRSAAAKTAEKKDA